MWKKTAPAEDVFAASAPSASGPTREEMEQQRFNEEWRRLRSFQEAAVRRAAGRPATASAPLDIVFVNDPKFAEKPKDVDPDLNPLGRLHRSIPN